MQKRIEDIRQKISALPARTKWDKGVRGYAKELFDDYINSLNIKDGTIRIGKITEADLLRGAKDWGQYSWSCLSEVDNAIICERLCNKAEIRKTNNGEFRLNPNEDWRDVRARALSQAAHLVLNAVNRRDEHC